MDVNKLAERLTRLSPEHFRDIYAAVDMLCDELGYTKSSLGKDLMKAQENDDFSTAREILDTQEDLLHAMNIIQQFLSEFKIEQEFEDDVPEDELPISEDDSDDAERIDYSQYDMDDTIAYDIENTPVTFKRPAAFSYKGKRHPVTKWKILLVQLCSIFYREQPDTIRSMVGEERQAGQRRVKLSLNPGELHSPAQISNSDIWIETNRSAANIRTWILLIMDRLGVPYEEVKVFFRRDYAALHSQDEQETMSLRESMDDQ